MPRSSSSASGTREVQFKLLLPRQLHQRIGVAAEEHRVSVSEEIRRRLEGSFGPEVDEDTLKLAEAIKLMAPPGWRTSPRSFETLLRALEVLLGQLQPSPGVTRNPTNSGRYDGALLAGRALAVFGLPVRLGELPLSLNLEDKP
jgi:hypothetical protein